MQLKEEEFSVMSSNKTIRRVADYSEYFKQTMDFVAENGADRDILNSVIDDIESHAITGTVIRTDNSQRTGNVETYFKYQISKYWLIHWIESEMESVTEINGMTAKEVFTEIKFVKTDLKNVPYHSTTYE